MDLPHRRPEERDAFDQHIPASVRLDELRAQIMALPEDPPADGNSVFSHVEKSFAIVFLIWVPLLPSTILAALPGPPVLTVAVAVNRAFTGDGDVLLPEGINK